MSASIIIERNLEDYCLSYTTIGSKPWDKNYLMLRVVTVRLFRRVAQRNAKKTNQTFDFRSPIILPKGVQKPRAQCLLSEHGPLSALKNLIKVEYLQNSDLFFICVCVFIILKIRLEKRLWLCSEYLNIFCSECFVHTYDSELRINGQRKYLRACELPRICRYYLVSDTVIFTGYRKRKNHTTSLGGKCVPEFSQFL